MDSEEFERMDDVRRDIRGMAIDLLVDVKVLAWENIDVPDLERVEDFAYEAAEKIITAKAEQVAEQVDNRPTPQEVRLANTPDEKAILGRD